MNILFFTRNQVSPNIGGTERVTLTLGSGLKKHYNYKCYSAYIHPNEGNNHVFCGETRLRRSVLTNDILNYIEDNSIDWLICQGEFRIAIKIKNALKKKRCNCKVMAVHHFAPGWEEKFVTPQTIISKLKSHQKIQAFKQILLYPYLKWQALTNAFIYKKAYHVLDYISLLSKNFIPEFMDYAKITDKRKFKVIPNPLSFEEQISINKIDHKQNIVLIVGRLEENQKRISLALEIWRRLNEELIDAHNWSLHIAGDGPDKNMYQNIVKSKSIPNVVFLGKINPVEEYRKASIFIMTSRYEGRPLTITEALQFGVVPIAMNTFSSLTDLINDGVNGFVIPNNDLDSFIKKLAILITNHTIRKEMAKQTILSAEKFSIPVITKKWVKILNENYIECRD